MDSSDAYVNQRLARAKGLYGPTYGAGYVHEPSLNGEGLFQNSYDMTPSAERLRYRDPSKNTQRRQRSLKVRSIQSDD